MSLPVVMISLPAVIQAEVAHLADCNSKKEKKIPTLELAFMMSMKAFRSPGQKATMVIAGVDTEETKTCHTQ